MRRLLRLLALISAMLLLLGNSNCSKNNASDAPQFVTSLQMEDVNGNLASGFAPGATVKLVLNIRNRTTSTQTLWFNSSQLYNFAAVNSGTADVVWNWDSGQTFDSSAFTSLAFNAGETKTFTIGTWTLTDDNGTNLVTGNYEVFGGFTVYNTAGAGAAADNGSSMIAGQPTAAQMFPTVYRSTLQFFSIQ